MQPNRPKESYSRPPTRDTDCPCIPESVPEFSKEKSNRRVNIFYSYFRGNGWEKFDKFSRKYGQFAWRRKNGVKYFLLVSPI